MAFLRFVVVCLALCTILSLSKKITTRKRRQVCTDLLEKRKCRKLKKIGMCERNVVIRKKFCSLTCKECSASPKDNGVKQPKGPCILPDVPHGKVVISGNRNFLKRGEILVIECDPGYVKIGEESTCVAQDVFSPDSSLITQCVAESSSEVLHGNGTDYDGTRSVTASGKKCLNWNMELNAGSAFILGKEAFTFPHENHNFCRNKNGYKPVPYCLVDNSATRFLGAEKLQKKIIEPEFCFSSPGCDGCAGELLEDRLDKCPLSASAGKCDFMSMFSYKNQEYYWTYCRKSCCKNAGCILE